MNRCNGLGFWHRVHRVSGFLLLQYRLVWPAACECAHICGGMHQNQSTGSNKQYTPTFTIPR